MKNENDEPYYIMGETILVPGSEFGNAYTPYYYIDVISEGVFIGVGLFVIAGPVI